MLVAGRATPRAEHRLQLPVELDLNFLENLRACPRPALLVVQEDIADDIRCIFTRFLPSGRVTQICLLS